MLKIGLIGYQNHAARLMGIVSDSELAAVSAIYHPDKDLDFSETTRDIEDLLHCDAVMIASPNDTHFDYLSYFTENYTGYIFCEKPPLSSMEELEKFSGDPDRTFFNFNYRFSRVREAVSESIHNGSLGQPIHMFASMSQGLAFKDSYPGSWRADAKRHRHGVTETKSVHYIDMACFLFGELLDYNYSPSNVAKTGSAFDTSFISLKFKQGQNASLFMSYATPLTSEIRIIGTNGVIEYKDNILSIASPRDTFDERGFFASPPEEIIFDYNGLSQDMYDESLERSVSYFLRQCSEGSRFPESLFQTSLDTNRLTLELTDSPSTT